MSHITKPLSMQMENSAITLYQIDANSADELHDHSDCYQIGIPLIGTPMAQCNQELRSMTPGQRLVLSPGYQHRHFARNETIRMMLMFIDDRFLQKVFADKTGTACRSIEFAPWAEHATDGFRRLAEMAIKVTLNHPLETIQLQEFEWELANLLLSRQDGSHADKWLSDVPVYQHPALSRVIEYIHDDVAAELTLDKLTALSGLSKFHFLRLFRHHVGSTPSQYVSQVRLDRAEKLLRQVKMEITSIAFEVGFGSLSSFERAFKKRYGASPVEYRKNLSE